MATRLSFGSWRPLIHFGMKAHIGVDVASGLVHTVVGTIANEADITPTAKLLHGQEENVFGDAGYTGADKRPELADRDVSPAFAGAGCGTLPSSAASSRRSRKRCGIWPSRSGSRLCTLSMKLPPALP